MEDFRWFCRSCRTRVEVFEFRYGDFACGDSLDDEEGGCYDEGNEEKKEGAPKLALWKHASAPMYNDMFPP